MFIVGLRLSEMTISLSVILPWHPLMKGGCRGKSLHLKILVWGKGESRTHASYFQFFVERCELLEDCSHFLSDILSWKWQELLNSVILLLELSFPSVRPFVRSFVRPSPFLTCITHACIIDTTHSQMLGKFEYTRGPIFKVVLEC